MATPINYNEGSNRPIRIYGPAMDPSGANLAGTCGGMNIGLSTGVLNSGMTVTDGFYIPTAVIGYPDAGFSEVGFYYYQYNPTLDIYGYCQFQVATQVAAPGAKMTTRLASYNVTKSTAQIGDEAWGISPLT